MEVVRELINAKADVNTTKNDDSPLSEAIINEHADMISLLAEHKADINRTSVLGEEPLMYAMLCSNRLELMEALVNAKADVNKTDNLGNTPIRKAICLGDEEVVNYLIDARADVNKTDYFETPPIVLACLVGKIGIIKKLITNKADLSKMDQSAYAEDCKPVLQQALEELKPSNSEDTSYEGLSCNFNPTPIFNGLKSGAIKGATSGFIFGGSSVPAAVAGMNVGLLAGGIWGAVEAVNEQKACERSMISHKSKQQTRRKSI